MRKRNPALKEKTQPEMLKGWWRQIASFLGEPISVVQRWTRTGMPVSRQGRSVVTSAEQLNAWLGRESGKPVHIITPEADLTAELKRGLSAVRREKYA
jgi:hypothetical protein